MHIDSRSEEHTSELQSHSDLVCRLLLEKKKNDEITMEIQHKKNNQNNKDQLYAALEMCPLVIQEDDILDILFSRDHFLFFLMIRLPSRSTLFPYTTLFR